MKPSFSQVTFQRPKNRIIVYGAIIIENFTYHRIRLEYKGSCQRDHIEFDVDKLSCQGFARFVLAQQQLDDLFYTQ